MVTWVRGGFKNIDGTMEFVKSLPQRLKTHVPAKIFSRSLWSFKSVDFLEKLWYRMPQAVMLFRFAATAFLAKGVHRERARLSSYR